MADAIKCPKCGGAMTEGFIFDRGHYNAKSQQVWVEGIPEESIWSGLKTSGKDAYNVEAFHCEKCGFLEFYSTDKIDLNGIFN
ncbi:MAG: PF20097 family protein [Pyrinomonadaceae bacterium]